MKDMSDEPTAVVGKLLEIMDRDGWGVIVATDYDGSRFAYTVGLTLKQLPELCISCADAEQGQSVLNALAARQIDDGRFAPGQVTQVEGRSVRLEPNTDLGPMILVRKMFGGNSTAPAALAVTFLD
ncbi:DUF4262 domain-containing protein (plasmid) [Amycolatopsis sp. FU40]|uniref:DUF4262 domain-containing protein n=1 Tax=Amycolatopsis sp. FU40 TaxID=2914159 RepID=UPI001F2F2BCE|nr:DUF4262 domain-containing protein [Amycolatopsis sp. FU40]UKD50922.1 DUF4262 domain-containing protein [Amycolatopsis sp. FU40]